MKTLIKQFYAHKEQSSKKAVISRVLEDINNACILALSFDKSISDSTEFFDDFVATIDNHISNFISAVDYYEQHKENSEVSDPQA